VKQVLKFGAGRIVEYTFLKAVLREGFIKGYISDVKEAFFVAK
jgi:hypothetical protein